VSEETIPAHTRVAVDQDGTFLYGFDRDNAEAIGFGLFVMWCSPWVQTLYLLCLVLPLARLWHLIYVKQKP
jgi:hypothetical protein